MPQQTPPFISGLDLNERFYREVVGPILARDFPGLPHSAARLGPGSEVLGYDDVVSTDHDWGPRFQLFLAESDHPALAGRIDRALQQRLPRRFLGYPTGFGPPDEEGTRLPAVAEDGPVLHRVEITTVAAFFRDLLAYDIRREPTVSDWLAWPQQELLSVTRGRVFVDGLGDLEPVRRRLARYPSDVRLYLLACQWARIAQEEHFVGRTGSVGDELGSRLLAARLVHDQMLLCFLLEERYAPYPKWFGTAFKELACAPALMPHLDAALAADSWPEREAALCAAYEAVGRMHNELGITAPVDPTVRSFFGRPFRVLFAGRFSRAALDAVRDERVRAVIAAVGDIGSVDQFSHSTDLRAVRLQPRLRSLYE